MAALQHTSCQDATSQSTRKAFAFAVLRLPFAFAVCVFLRVCLDVSVEGIVPLVWCALVLVDVFERAL